MLARGKAPAARKAAYRKFIEPTEQAAGETTSRTTVRGFVDSFLEHVRANLKPNTYDGYRRFLLPFAETFPVHDGNAVQPKHVTSYLAKHESWGRTTRCNVITAIERAWAWAVTEGHSTIDQVAAMKRPQPERRAELPDDRVVETFIKHASPEFRELLLFLRETGCRPGEAIMIERRHIDVANREVRFKIGEDKTSDKTVRQRVIKMNMCSHYRIVGLLSRQSSGKVFVNGRGDAWTRFAINCAVRRARKKTGLDNRTVCHSLRHQYVTDALARGVPIATVAEMCGTSPEMIVKVYSHLSDRKALLLKAAEDLRSSS